MRKMHRWKQLPSMRRARLCGKVAREGSGVKNGDNYTADSRGWGKLAADVLFVSGIMHNATSRSTKGDCSSILFFSPLFSSFKFSDAMLREKGWTTNVDNTLGTIRILGLHIRHGKMEKKWGKKKQTNKTLWGNCSLSECLCGVRTMQPNSFATFQYLYHADPRCVRSQGKCNPVWQS